MWRMLCGYSKESAKSAEKEKLVFAGGINTGGISVQNVRGNGGIGRYGML